MVKFRAGKKKTTPQNEGVVIAEFKRVHRLPRFRLPDLTKLRTKHGAIIVLLILVLLAATVVLVTWGVKRTNQPAVIVIPSEQEFVTSQISRLEKNAPPANASRDEQIKYYEELQKYYELADNYAKAAESFRLRADVDSKDLDHEDYMRAARYYSIIGDKPNAIASYDKAISLLPNTVNEDTGYYPDLVKAKLERAKQELQK